jgi:hypothetical protein
VDEIEAAGMVLTRQQGSLKNRIHASLAKYGVTIEGASYTLSCILSQQMFEHSMSAIFPTPRLSGLLPELPIDSSRAV